PTQVLERAALRAAARKGQNPGKCSSERRCAPPPEKGKIQASARASGAARRRRELTGTAARRPSFLGRSAAMRFVRGLAIALALWALGGVAAAQQAAPDPTYAPSPGQAGKDVVWLPTP